MPWWGWLLDAWGLLLGLLLVYGLALILRRRLVARGGGAFELSFRARTDRPGRGWQLGFARYSGEKLEWFRTFSLRPSPSRRWDRADLEYAGRRERIGGEEISIFSGHVLVLLDTPGGSVEMAMSESSLTGFQAWLEAMPPGSRGVRPGDAPDSY